MHEITLAQKGKERKRIYIAPFIYYVQVVALKKPNTKIAITPKFLGEFLYFLHQWKQK